MAWEDALSACERFDFEDGPWTRPVWRRGSGPAVIFVHEIPGFHPSSSALRTGRRTSTPRPATCRPTRS